MEIPIRGERERPRVLLRDVTEEDLPVLFVHQIDPDAIEMAAFQARDRDAFMAHWTKILGDAAVLKKAILCDGQVAGHVASFDRSGEREVGYWIAKEHWGKGIATQALAAFLIHEKARPLCARVAKHNVGSLRVLEKCGFMLASRETGAPDARGEPVEEFVLRLGASDGPGSGSGASAE